jgi:hypothetical protein
VVDNATNGFDIHNLDDGTLMTTFETGQPIQRRPKQVAFAEGSKLVVCGSDRGVVYLFDRQSGALVGQLKHAKDGLVQTIAVSVSCIREGSTVNE